MTTHGSLVAPTTRAPQEARRRVRKKDHLTKGQTRRFASAGASHSRHSAYAYAVATRILGETLAALVLLLALLMSLRAIWAR
jgi:hypothetical protein